MRNLKKTAVWLGVGLFSTLLVSEAALAAHSRGSNRARDEIRQDMREVRKSRDVYRDDVRELRRDRAELHQDLRRGAPAGEIARDRAELRESRRDVIDSRRELAQDRAELERDLERYEWYRENDGYWRRRYGWYDNDRWGRDRWDRDRYGWWGWRDWWR
jgi:hypothetical protein